MLNPVELLTAAEGIVVQGQERTQAEYRSAVHLAYYAVYHMIARHLKQEVLGDNGMKHREIAHILRASAEIDPVIQEARRNFSRLMTLRFRSDYDLEAVIDAAAANDAVDWAYEIFDAKAV